MPKLTWSCTCPDYTKRRSALINKKGFAQTIDSDWSNEYNLTYADCKHIMSAKINQSKMGESPTDVPLPKSNVPLSDWGSLGSSSYLSQK
jgi:hypothetical protein